MKGRPLNKTDLLEHEKRYETVVRKRMAELEEDRLRKVANADYDPDKFKTAINQRVYLEDEMKKKEMLNRLNQKRLLAEKKMSYGEFVNKIHKPVISIKKKMEMEALKDKIKHPIKETVKIPSSASYHDLYNLNGKNPWNTVSQSLGQTRSSSKSHQKFTTPTNKFSSNQKLVSELRKKKKFYHKSVKHESTENITLKEHGDDSEEGSEHADPHRTEVHHTNSSTLNEKTETDGLPRKLIIKKKTAYKPPMSMQGVRHRPSPKRLKVPKRINQHKDCKWSFDFF